MTQALRKLVTFEEFAKWKPEDGRYELYDGDERIQSPTFPEFNLTAQQIFN